MCEDEPMTFLNRPFKFRTWFFKQHRMAEVTQLHANEDHLVLYTDKSYLLSNVSDCHLMQFTGLHDRSGQAIYEGDVALLYVTYLGNEEKGFLLCQIVYETGQFIVSRFSEESTHRMVKPLAAIVKIRKTGQKWCPALEVIGHIYQELDLLKQEIKVRQEKKST